VGDDARHIRQLELAARDQAVVDRVDVLGDDPHVRGLGRQRVECGRDSALERVLDRHERALGRALVHGHHGLVDGREGNRLDAVRRRRAQRLLGEGAGRPEKGDAH
jgi:hypothetical protein